MTLVVDLDAIRANATAVSAYCSARGLLVRGVVKSAYAVKPILEAFISGGVTEFSISTVAALQAIPPDLRGQAELVGLYPASSAASVRGSLPRSLVSSNEVALALDQASSAREKRHQCFVVTRTSDDREGMRLEDAMDTAVRWVAQHPALQIVGLYAAFGCCKVTSPTPNEISLLDSAARAIAASTGQPEVELALGGSVLLSACDWLARFRSVGRLRLGESIVCGTIPGGQDSPIPLRRPFQIDARVLECTSTNIGARLRHEVLLDIGRNTIDETDIILRDYRCRALGASSEYSRFALASDSACPELGETVVLELGYRSMTRAMLNRSTRINWRSLERGGGLAPSECWW